MFGASRRRQVVERLPGSTSAVVAPSGVTESVGEVSASYRAHDRNAPQLTLVLRWYRPVKARELLFGTAFALFWNALWVTAVVGGIVEGRSLPWSLVVLITLLALVGAVMLYSLPLWLFNRTTLVITGRELLAEHGPLPVGGAVRLDRDEVTSVWCQRTSSRHPGDAGRAVGLLTRYEVVAQLRSGREIVLTSPMSEPSEAQVRYLEHRVRDQLGLVSATDDSSPGLRVADEGSLSSADEPAPLLDDETDELAQEPSGRTPSDPPKARLHQR